MEEILRLLNKMYVDYCKSQTDNEVVYVNLKLVKPAFETLITKLTSQPELTDIQKEAFISTIIPLVYKHASNQKAIVEIINEFEF